MRTLECGECGCRSEEPALGWKGYLAGGSNDAGAEELEVIFFCPPCAARQFSWKERDEYDR